MSMDTLESFHNLLQSGKVTTAKKVLEDLDMSWATIDEVDLSKYGKDDLSTTSIPDDINSTFASNPVALSVTGNGNCLILSPWSFAEMNCRAIPCVFLSQRALLQSGVIYIS